MQITVNNKKQTENTDKVQLQQDDKNILSTTNDAFSQILQGEISKETLNIEGIKKLPDIDFCYDAMSMDLQDALFFINLTKEGQFSVQTTQEGTIQSIVKTEIVQTSIAQKTLEVTNQLTSLIEKAQKTNKPVRISFDNNISVILRIDKHGKVSAEFIPGSIEAENYLMTNIASLRQKFDEQNLPYTNLSYRQNGRGSKNNKEKNKGEA